MTYENGITSDDTSSRKYDWNKFYKDADKVKLLQQSLSSNHYKLYQVQETFYLTDKNDEYVGSDEIFEHFYSIRIQDEFLGRLFLEGNKSLDHHLFCEKIF